MAVRVVMATENLVSPPRYLLNLSGDVNMHWVSCSHSHILSLPKMVRLVLTQLQPCEQPRCTKIKASSPSRVHSQLCWLFCALWRSGVICLRFIEDIVQPGKSVERKKIVHCPPKYKICGHHCTPALKVLKWQKVKCLETVK